MRLAPSRAHGTILFQEELRIRLGIYTYVTWPMQSFPDSPLQGPPLMVPFHNIFPGSPTRNNLLPLLTFPGPLHIHLAISYVCLDINQFCVLLSLPRTWAPLTLLMCVHPSLENIAKFSISSITVSKKWIKISEYNIHNFDKVCPNYMELWGTIELRFTEWETEA